MFYCSQSVTNCYRLKFSCQAARKSSERRVKSRLLVNGVFCFDKIINGKNKGRFAANEYLISLDMAKELAMVENNEQGRKVRRYFIEVEKQFRNADAVTALNRLQFVTD